jgi:uncharacterized protein
MERKIIFTGPVGSGKTTAIGAISDIEVVKSEAKATDDVALRKASTTVAMDYGMLSLGGGESLHLYGTPGQDRFSFMWDILCKGGMGLVIMLDSARPDPLSDLDFYLDAFKQFIKDCGCHPAVVVGVTRMDMKGSGYSLLQYAERLKTRGIQIPVFEVDAREREDVKRILLSMLALLDPSTAR